MKDLTLLTEAQCYVDFRPNSCTPNFAYYDDFYPCAFPDGNAATVKWMDVKWECDNFHY